MQTKYIIAGSKRAVYYDSYHEAEKIAKWLGVHVGKIKEVHINRC